MKLRTLFGAGISTALLALSLTVAGSTAASATTHHGPAGAKVAATASSGTLSLDVYDYQNPSENYQTVEMYADAYYNNGDGGGCSITNYSWDFGDGHATAGASASDVTHNWQPDGSYKVTASVTD